MELISCKECKKLFQYISGPKICLNCRDAEEEKFAIVKEYLRENPKEQMHVVAKETGVSNRLIEKFLREGRLEVAEGSPIQLCCDRCGKTIRSGRYCKVCMTEIQNDFQKVSDSGKKPEPVQSQQPSGARMRFIHK